MSKFNQRVIHSISTGPQPSEPLPKDVIIGPAAPGTQYIQRCRYLYRWPNRQERNLDKIKLYEGTIAPLPSQILFYRNRARRVVAVFEQGHDIEPPLIEDSKIPHATIIVTREFLCNIPPSVALPGPSSQEFTFNFSSSCRGTPSDHFPRRNAVPPHTHFATNDINNGEGGSTIGSKRRMETDGDDRGDSSSKRSKLTTFATSPVLAFVLGVAVGTFSSH